MCGCASVFHDYVLLRDGGMEKVEIQRGAGDMSVGNDYAIN